jgi:hypothetical protein
MQRVHAFAPILSLNVSLTSVTNQNSFNCFGRTHLLFLCCVSECVCVCEYVYPFVCVRVFVSVLAQWYFLRALVLLSLRKEAI